MADNTSNRGRPNRAVSLALCLVLGSWSLLPVGCGDSKLATKVLHGTVTLDGQKVETGWLRFVPIDGTPGPASTARIVDGEYRIEARGGVPVGKHRVEVDARKRTGRKVRGDTGTETGMVDETVRLGPEEYAGVQSPLTVELTADSNGRIDIEIPRR